MDFAWSQEQDALYNNVLAQVRNCLHSYSDQFWTRAQWQLCGDMHLLGLCVPVRYGGRGYDALTTAHVLEAFGNACEDMGLVFSSAAHLFACAMPLVEAGSEALKNTYLPGLCSGELVGANAITESDAGSDIFALHTRAIHEGDTYRLEGHKSYVSNGPSANVFVVYAVTNPAHGYLGISGFLVERDAVGLSIGEPFQKMGLTSTPACEIAFHDCLVPERNRLGCEGQGAQIFKRSMLWERACLFAAYVGKMGHQLEKTIQYTQQRHQFGKALSKHQAIAHRLADMKLRIESARYLLYRACWLIDQGQDATLAISLSKLAISEAAIQNGLDALHLHGSVGFGKAAGIEQMLRDAIPSTIFSGTSEMQRDIIARELGL